MFAKAEMACQVFFRVCPNMKQAPSLLIVRIQGCSSFLQSYKESQFQLADIISNFKTFNLFYSNSPYKLEDFPQLELIAHILKKLKDYTKSKVIDADREFFRRMGYWMIDYVKHSDVKSISNWFSTLVVNRLETLDSQNDYAKATEIQDDYGRSKKIQHSPRSSLYRVLDQFIGQLIYYICFKKIEDLWFFDELINKLGNKLWTEHYGDLLKELLDWNFPDFLKALIEKKRNASDARVRDFFNALGPAADKKE